MPIITVSPVIGDVVWGVVSIDKERQIVLRELGSKSTIEAKARLSALKDRCIYVPLEGKFISLEKKEGVYYPVRIDLLTGCKAESGVVYPNFASAVKKSQEVASRLGVPIEPHFFCHSCE